MVISQKEQAKVRKANRLINEKSPYLLQHAHNPIDWFPWGTEAFNQAKEEDKPIFLSIGYSTCHWCHIKKCIKVKSSYLSSIYIYMIMLALNHFLQV